MVGIECDRNREMNNDSKAFGPGIWMNGNVCTEKGKV